MTVIAESLVSVLISYLFNKNMDTDVNIKNVPSWYMKQIDPNKLNSFSYADGDLDAVDKAKEKAKIKLIKRIKNATIIIVDDNFSNLKGKDKELVNNFSRYDTLKVFIYENLKYEKIEYNDVNKRAFVKAYIKKDKIKEYQEKRIQKIKNKISYAKSKDLIKRLHERIK